MFYIHYLHVTLTDWHCGCLRMSMTLRPGLTGRTCWMTPSPSVTSLSLWWQRSTERQSGRTERWVTCQSEGPLCNALTRVGYSCDLNGQQTEIGCQVLMLKLFCWRLFYCRQRHVITKQFYRDSFTFNGVVACFVKVSCILSQMKWFSIITYTYKHTYI